MTLGGLAFAFALGLGIPLGFYSAVRRGHWQDFGASFVAMLAVIYIRFFRRSALVPPFRPEPKRLLRATLLSFRGIATVTFIFLAVTAIYELLLRIVGNQPPFFLLATLVSAAMYVLILAYILFDYIQECRTMDREQ